MVVVARHLRNTIPFLPRLDGWQNPSTSILHRFMLQIILMSPTVTLPGPPWAMRLSLWGEMMTSTVVGLETMFSQY